MLGYLDPGTGSIVLQVFAGLGCILSVPVLIIVAIRMSARNATARAGAALSRNPPPPPPGGRWYADPTARYAQRWWSGDDWTDEVVLASGQRTTDPTPLSEPRPPAPGAG